MKHSCVCINCTHEQQWKLTEHTFAYALEREIPLVTLSHILTYHL